MAPSDHDVDERYMLKSDFEAFRRENAAQHAAVMRLVTDLRDSFNEMVGGVKVIKALGTIGMIAATIGLFIATVALVIVTANPGGHG